MRRVVIFSVLIALALGVGWFFFMYQPATVRESEAREELEQAENEEVQLMARLAQLKKVQDNEFAYLDALGAIRAALPDTPEVDVLIDDLTNLAEDTGVDWQSVTFGTPALVEGADYYEVPVSLVIEGQYFEILGYVYGITELPRIVVIDGISINSAQVDGFTILTVSLSGRTFSGTDIVIPIQAEESEEEEATEGDSGGEGGG